MEYYNSLKGLLMELDLYQNMEMKCTVDSKKMRDMLEIERVFQFLLGLNPELDQTCERILGKDLFPDFNEAFSHICGEESCKELMGNKTENCDSLTTENSALAMIKQNQIVSDNKKLVDTDKMWCDYCNKSRHTRAMCWKLHGKPQNQKQIGNKGGNQPTRLGQGNHTTIVKEKLAQMGFNKSDIEKLKQLLNELENSNANSSSYSGSCSMAQSGCYL